MAVNLEGKVDGLSPVNIKANIGLNGGDSDLLMAFNSMPLPFVTPYMAEFVGRKIEKGNMSLELNYQVKDKQLTAFNNLYIDQLVLGEAVENPNAVSLPLDFAIALLEDSEGKIALDVPITGSLEDPDFSIAGVVMDAFVNVITKVIASPFSAIASLMGSDDDMSQVHFEAGKAVFSETEQTKLQHLVDALVQRPNLVLEIKGMSFSQQDWSLLQKEALTKQLLSLKAKALKQAKNEVVLIEHIQLSDQETRHFLGELFIQTFPTLATRDVFGKVKLVDKMVGDFQGFAVLKLAELIPPNVIRLNQLAGDRAEVIAKYLLNQGIPMARLFLLDVDMNSEAIDVNAIVSELNLTIK